MGNAFRDRAKTNRFRFTQPEAMQAALKLLADLPDDEYEQLLLSFR